MPDPLSYVVERSRRGRWPNDARIAVLISFDFQGDEGLRAEQLETQGWLNYQEISEGDYGPRRGIWRILRILDKHDVKATFCTAGALAERYPDVIAELARRGHEVACHGYHHERQWLLKREEEVEVVRRATEAIERVTGTRPTGWRCQKNRTSDNTLDVIAEMGYTWNSDFHNDDLPYMLDVHGRRLVEIPYSWETGDQSVMNKPSKSPQQPSQVMTQAWKNVFNTLYDESTIEPSMFISCTHPFAIGRPSRAGALDEFIAYVKGFEGVWFARCGEVAQWWTENGY